MPWIAFGYDSHRLPWRPHHLCPITSNHEDILIFSPYFPHTISSTDHIHDLGVLIDSELTFKAHVNNIIHKAFQNKSNPSNAFTQKTKILTRSYCTQVCPILKHCSPVWSPHNRQLIKIKIKHQDQMHSKIFHKNHLRIENNALQKQTSATRTLEH